MNRKKKVIKTIQYAHPPHHHNGFLVTCRLWTASGGGHALLVFNNRQSVQQAQGKERKYILPLIDSIIFFFNFMLLRFDLSNVCKYMFVIEILKLKIFDDSVSLPSTSLHSTCFKLVRYLDCESEFL